MSHPSTLVRPAPGGGGAPRAAETPRDVRSIEAAGLPADLPRSTYEQICRGAALDPDGKALSFFLRVKEHRRPEVWTYRELVRDITRAANLFHELEVKKDDVVAFVLPNLPETHFTAWGSEAAGITFAINPLLEPAVMAELLNAAQARVVVTLAPFPGTDLWQKVQGIVRRVPTLRHVVLVRLADRVRGLPSLVARAAGKREEWRLHGKSGVRGAVPAGVSVHDFGSALRRQPADRLRSGRQIEPGDIASFLCTGGTTGTPKIAMRTHGNEVTTVWTTGQYCGEFLDATRSFFCGLPLFHTNGLLLTGLLPFSAGAHVVLGTPQGYRGDGVVPRFWEIVEHHRINYVSGVPTLYAALLHVPRGSRRIDSLQYALCGAAPMPVGLFRAFERQTGARLLEGYGLTEGTFICSSNPLRGERRIGSIGLRMPFQDMKVVIADEQGRYVRECAAGEEGVIAISGPNVFAGYQDPRHEKGIWLDLGDGRTWLNTGDMGRRDAEGYFYITGRKKDLIIRGGHNIDPLAIEEVLLEHPAVQLAAAFGRVDAYAGELPVAYVQLKPSARATEEELRQFTQERIGERAARPTAVRIVDALPLTALGKIFKPALRHRETREVLLAALRSVPVEVVAVEVAADAALGTLAQVTLAVEAQAEAAGEVLGRFPVPFRLRFDGAAGARGAPPAGG